jgi:CheY-like chemotaxis protein
LDPKPVDLNAMIAGMEELIRRTMGPQIEVRVRGATDLWASRLDISQLENSLLNLCINARDAMVPRAGVLTIETSNEILDAQVARERDVAAGQYVALRVTDTGIGMSPDVVARAFDPFFTTKPLGQGTGLGLSMIYGFVRQSGGYVSIDSQVGRGTLMTLYFPRFKGAVEPIVILADSEIEVVGGSQTLLIVDDERTIRMLIADVLAEAGYSTLLASDGPGATKIIESGVHIDLLVTDVGLPGGMNGRQIADFARLSRPELGVLFITGYVENAAVGDGQLEPGMELLIKPFEMNTLVQRVRAMLS